MEFAGVLVLLLTMLVCIGFILASVYLVVCRFVGFPKINININWSWLKFSWDPKFPNQEVEPEKKVTE